MEIANTIFPVQEMDKNVFPIQSLSPSLQI